MNKTIPAVAAAALAVYLDRSARRRHREHMSALRLYRTSVSIHDVSMYARPDTPGPFVSVDGPYDDVLTPTVAARVAAARSTCAKTFTWSGTTSTAAWPSSC